MNCPECAHKSTVIDSRKINEGQIYRRRKCLNKECGHRWRTYESSMRILTPDQLKAQMREVAAQLAKLARYVLEIQSSVE